MRTESGTATGNGIKRANRGTATSDSPKPKVDRTNVAKKLMIITGRSISNLRFLNYFQFTTTDMSWDKNYVKIGRIFYGLAIAAMGLVTIYYRDFPYMLIPAKHTWLR